MNNDIDTALIAAIKASSTIEPTKATTTKICRLVPVISDDEPLLAAADRSKFVQFADVIHCVGVGSTINV
jgi:hypothetical protein